MKRILPMAATLCLATAALGQNIVFDNTGGLPANTKTGGALIYADSGYQSGIQFEAPFDFTLDYVELVLYMIDGVTNVTASIYQEDGPTQFSIVASQTIAGGDMSPSNPRFYTFDFLDEYSFLEGTKVWLTVSNASGTLAWGKNGANVGGVQQQFMEFGDTITPSGSFETPQYSAKIVAIPEPSAIGLTFGFTGLLFYITKRRNRSSVSRSQNTTHRDCTKPQ